MVVPGDGGYDGARERLLHLRAEAVEEARQDRMSGRNDEKEDVLDAHQGES